jgi:hypothetical protein
MLEMVSGAVPLFRSMTDCDGLVAVTGGDVKNPVEIGKRGCFLSRG